MVGMRSLACLIRAHVEQTDHHPKFLLDKFFIVLGYRLASTSSVSLIRAHRRVDGETRKSEASVEEGA